MVNQIKSRSGPLIALVLAVAAFIMAIFLAISSDSSVKVFPSLGNTDTAWKDFNWSKYQFDDASTLLPSGYGLVYFITLDPSGTPFLATNTEKTAAKGISAWLPSYMQMSNGITNGGALIVMSDNAINKATGTSADDFKVGYYDTAGKYKYAESKNSVYNELITGVGVTGASNITTPMFYNDLLTLYEGGGYDAVRGGWLALTSGKHTEAQQLWRGFASGDGSKFSDNIRAYLALEASDSINDVNGENGHTAWSSENWEHNYLHYVDLLMTLYCMAPEDSGTATYWAKAIENYMIDGVVMDETASTPYNIFIQAGVALNFPDITDSSGSTISNAFTMVTTASDIAKYGFMVTSTYDTGNKSLLTEHLYEIETEQHLYEHLFTNTLILNAESMVANNTLANGVGSFPIAMSYYNDLWGRMWSWGVHVRDIDNPDRAEHPFYFDKEMTGTSNSVKVSDYHEYFYDSSWSSYPSDDCFTRMRDVIQAIPMMPSVTGDVSGIEGDFKTVWANEGSTYKIVSSSNESVGDSVQFKVTLTTQGANLTAWKNLASTYSNFNIAVNITRVVAYSRDLTKGGDYEEINASGPTSALTEPQAINGETLYNIVSGSMTYSSQYDLSMLYQTIKMEQMIILGYDVDVVICWGNDSSCSVGSITIPLSGTSGGFTKDVADKGTENACAGTHVVTAYREEENENKIIYYTEPTAYAEIKEGTVQFDGTGAVEDYEAMAGVPSTEFLYFSSGGSEFILEFQLEYMEGEHGGRTYNSKFYGTECEFKHQDQFKAVAEAQMPSDSKLSGSTTTSMGILPDVSTAESTAATVVYQETFVADENDIDYPNGGYPVDAQWVRAFIPDGASSHNSELKGHDPCVGFANNSYGGARSFFDSDEKWCSDPIDDTLCENSDPIYAEWTGTITNDTDLPEVVNYKNSADGKEGCKVTVTTSNSYPGDKGTENTKWGTDTYDTALYQALQFASAYEATNSTYTAMKWADSDNFQRIWRIGDAKIEVTITGEDPKLNNASCGATETKEGIRVSNYTGSTHTYTTADLINGSLSTNIDLGTAVTVNFGSQASQGECDDDPGPPPSHNVDNNGTTIETTLSKIANKSYTIRVTFPESSNGTDHLIGHDLCGTCCSHNMRAVVDKFAQFSTYDYAYFTACRVYKIHRSYVDGMEEITFSDYGEESGDAAKNHYMASGPIDPYTYYLADKQTTFGVDGAWYAHWQDGRKVISSYEQGKLQNGTETVVAAITQGDPNIFYNIAMMENESPVTTPTASNTSFLNYAAEVRNQWLERNNLASDMDDDALLTTTMACYDDVLRSWSNVYAGRIRYTNSAQQLSTVWIAEASQKGTVPGLDWDSTFGGHGTSKSYDNFGLSGAGMDLGARSNKCDGFGIAGDGSKMDSNYTWQQAETRSDTNPIYVKANGHKKPTIKEYFSIGGYGSAYGELPSSNGNVAGPYTKRTQDNGELLPTFSVGFLYDCVDANNNLITTTDEYWMQTLTVCDDIKARTVAIEGTVEKNGGYDFNSGGYPSTNEDEALLKDGYTNSSIDWYDYQTEEYYRFRFRRNRTNKIFVISDMLILQTSTGDQPVMYHWKSQTKRAQQHFDYVTADVDPIMAAVDSFTADDITLKDNFSDMWYNQHVGYVTNTEDWYTATADGWGVNNIGQYQKVNVGGYTGEWDDPANKYSETGVDIYTVDIAQEMANSIETSAWISPTLVTRRADTFETLFDRNGTLTDENNTDIITELNAHYTDDYGWGPKWPKYNSQGWLTDIYGQASDVSSSVCTGIKGYHWGKDQEKASSGYAPSSYEGGPPGAWHWGNVTDSVVRDNYKAAPALRLNSNYHSPGNQYSTSGETRMQQTSGLRMVTDMIEQDPTNPNGEYITGDAYQTYINILDWPILDNGEMYDGLKMGYAADSNGNWNEGWNRDELNNSLMYGLAKRMAQRYYDEDIELIDFDHDYEAGDYEMVWDADLSDHYRTSEKGAGYIIDATYSDDHTKVNDIVVHDPVSVQNALVIHNQKAEEAGWYSDTRTSDVAVFTASSLTDKIAELEVCPGDDTCEFKVLDCEYFEDITYVSLDFEPVGTDHSRTYNLAYDLDDGVTRKKYFDVGDFKLAEYYAQRYYVEDDPTTADDESEGGTKFSYGSIRPFGEEYGHFLTAALYPRPNNIEDQYNCSDTDTLIVESTAPSSTEDFKDKFFDKDYTGVGGTGNYGDKFKIDLSDIGLTSDNWSNHSLEFSFDIYFDSEDWAYTKNGVTYYKERPMSMIWGFNDFGFYSYGQDNSDKFGFLLGDGNEVRYTEVLDGLFGTSNNLKFEINFNDADGLDATIKDIKVYLNGREVSRTLWTTSGGTLKAEDIFGGSNTSFNIGCWNANNNYSARFAIDNLKIIRRAGTEEHTADCYETITQYDVGADYLCLIPHVWESINSYEGNVDSDDYNTARPYLWTVPVDGIYRVQAWGAAGGGTNGGNGGYASGFVSLSKGETLMIYPGGQGYQAPLQGPDYEYLWGLASGCGKEGSFTSSSYGDAIKLSDLGYDNANVVYTNSVSGVDMTSCGYGVWGKTNPMTSDPCPNHSSSMLFYKDPTTGEKSVIKRTTKNTVAASSYSFTQTYSYTGAVQTFTPSKTGSYYIEMWGASGGGSEQTVQNGTDADGNPKYVARGSHAGLGGYSSGYVNLTAGTTYYIFVGGQGTQAGSINKGGGYNGGGQGASSGYGGGGMSHISTTNNPATAWVEGGASTGSGTVSSRTVTADSFLGTDGSYHYINNVTAGKSYTLSSGYTYYVGVHTSGCGYGTNYHLFQYNGSKYTCLTCTHSCSMRTSDSSYPAYKVDLAKYLVSSVDTSTALTTITTSGSAQTWTAPADGYYKIVAYGANGYSGYLDGIGGAGGQANTTVYLTSGTKLYIYNGGYGTAEGVGTTTGAYNGGGPGYIGGGGATHVAITNRGVLKNYENYKDELVLVAGGGGGSERSTSPDNNSSTNAGGSGGGTTGGDGFRYGTNASTYATGGSQTAGGSGNETSSYGSGGAGSFGQGGTGVSGNYDKGPGGGGGWYGGGGSTWAGGAGGGSGHIGMSVISSGMSNGANSTSPSDTSGSKGGGYVVIYGSGYTAKGSWNSSGTLMVAAGGGGADNAGSNVSGNGTTLSNDDGSGGYGGGTRGEDGYVNGIYSSTGIYNTSGELTATGFATGATQTSGFMQGAGESASKNTDTGGAGAGWYGGKATNNNNGGAGGGSSYLSTSVSSGVTYPGVRNGNGEVIITYAGGNTTDTWAGAGFNGGGAAMSGGTNDTRGYGGGGASDIRRIENGGGGKYVLEKDKDEEGNEQASDNYMSQNTTCTYGPYIYAKAGTWQVDLYGTGFTDCVFEVYSNKNSQGVIYTSNLEKTSIAHPDNLKISDKHVEFFFTTTEAYAEGSNGLEIRVQFSDASGYEFESLYLSRLDDRMLSAGGGGGQGDISSAYGGNGGDSGTTGRAAVSGTRVTGAALSTKLASTIAEMTNAAGRWKAIEGIEFSGCGLTGTGTRGSEGYGFGYGESASYPTGTGGAGAGWYGGYVTNTSHGGAAGGTSGYNEALMDPDFSSGIREGNGRVTVYLYQHVMTDGYSKSFGFKPKTGSNTQAHQGQTQVEGVVQTWTAPETGTYKLEVWGAAGGEGHLVNGTGDDLSTDKGGAGGYSSIYADITAGTTLYIYVGGKGNDNTETAAKSYAAGGWNGGGASGTNLFGETNPENGGGGGGATHITLAADDAVTEDHPDMDRNKILIAAGGGGGAHNYARNYEKNGNSTYTASIGGNGGGRYGGWRNSYGSPGGQSSSSGSGHSLASDGWSLTGTNTNHDATAGNGGGWYGGSIPTTSTDPGTDYYGGLGGSGYQNVDPSGTGVTNVIAGELIGYGNLMPAPGGSPDGNLTDYYVDSTNKVNGNKASNSVTNGNGYARITKIQTGHNANCETAETSGTAVINGETVKANIHTHTTDCILHPLQYYYNDINYYQTATTEGENYNANMGELINAMIDYKNGNGTALKLLLGTSVYNSVGSQVTGYASTNAGARSYVTNVLANYITKIPESSEIFACNGYPLNDHDGTKNETTVLNCKEPHHSGNHYETLDQALENGHDSTCYDPCLNDDNHKTTSTGAVVDATTTKGTFYINTDEYFDLYFPTVGDFYESSDLGIAFTRQAKGLGYYDDMDTKEWIRERYVKFDFDVLFYRTETGLWEQYLAGEWIELPVKNGHDDVYTKGGDEFEVHWDYDQFEVGDRKIYDSSGYNWTEGESSYSYTYTDSDNKEQTATNSTTTYTKNYPSNGTEFTGEREDFYSFYCTLNNNEKGAAEVTFDAEAINADGSKGKYLYRDKYPLPKTEISVTYEDETSGNEKTNLFKGPDQSISEALFNMTNSQSWYTTHSVGDSGCGHDAHSGEYYRGEGFVNIYKFTRVAFWTGTTGSYSDYPSMVWRTQKYGTRTASGSTSYTEGDYAWHKIPKDTTSTEWKSLVGSTWMGNVEGGEIEGSKGKLYDGPSKKLLIREENRYNRVYGPVKENSNTSGNPATNHINNNDNYVAITNADRKASLVSYHGARKVQEVDLVGRIGNLMITNSTDVRWANFFKVPITDSGNYLVNGIVYEVDNYHQRNYFTWHINGQASNALALGQDIRNRWPGRVEKSEPGYEWLYDTWKTQNWKSVRTWGSEYTYTPGTATTDSRVDGTISGGTVQYPAQEPVKSPKISYGPLTTPLSAEKNNLSVYQNSLLEPGYTINYEITTHGNYAQKLRIKPYFYALSLSNDNDYPKGTLVPLDIYMLSDGTYQAINLWGYEDVVTTSKTETDSDTGNQTTTYTNTQKFPASGIEIYDYILSLDWDKEKEERMISKREDALTDLVHSTIWENSDEVNADGTYAQAQVYVPDGDFFSLGNLQLQEPGRQARTFIGQSLTAYENFVYKRGQTKTEDGLDLSETNFEDKFNLEDYAYRAQRWHLKLGLPSSSVFVPYDRFSGKRLFPTDEVNSMSSTDASTWDDWDTAHPTVTSGGELDAEGDDGTTNSGTTSKMQAMDIIANGDYAIVMTANIKALGNVWNLYYGQYSTLDGTKTSAGTTKEVRGNTAGDNGTVTINGTKYNFDVDTFSYMTKETSPDEEYGWTYDRSNSQTVLAVYNNSVTSEVDVDLIKTH